MIFQLVFFTFLFFVLTSRRYAIIKRTSLFPSQSNGKKIRNELAHYSGGCIKGYFHRRFHTRLQGKKYSKTVKNKQWPKLEREREKLSAIIRRRSRAYTRLKKMERRRSFELKNSASILNFLAVKLTATALKSMGGDIIYVTKCGS